LKNIADLRRPSMALACAALLAGLAHAQPSPTTSPAPPARAERSPFAPRPFASPATGKLVVYRGATLIDGRGGPALKDMAVMVDGATITQVFPAARLDTMRFAHVEIVDVGGKFLIPGLIDSHQHMATPPNRPQAQAQMRRDLYGGITAVRDMADDLRAIADYARETQTGEVAGPDIYYAALFAGPDFFDDPRVGAATELVKPGTAPWMQAITPQTDLKHAIARASGTSAIALKLYDNLTPDLVRAITAEAHAQGMKVWAHGMVFPTPPSEVIGAGVDVVSHTCYLAYQVSNPRPATYKDRRPVEAAKLEKGDDPQMAALFRAMKARGEVLDATVRVYAEYDKRLAAKPDMKPRPYCSAAVAAALTRQAYRIGVTIVTGTDGVPPRTEPWPALYDELALLVDKVGMKPAEVIRAATLEGARIVGQEAAMGSIEPGKLANFLVLDADPLASIANLKSLRFTVKRGHRFDRADYRPITAEEMPSDD
jgi:imidazolonepropionase-like amidohydrolase